MTEGQPRIAPAVGDRVFTDAYRSLRADGGIQFDLVPVAPPRRLPDWIETLGHWLHVAMRPFGRLIAWIAGELPQASYARLMLWAVVGLAAIGLAWLAARRIPQMPWRRRRTEMPAAEKTVWQPDATPARAWLDEAEALAGRGDYAGAVHHLLRRSVEDIERRRPRLLMPSFTSRDIALSLALPFAAREIFADIAHVVERSLFGGRAVGVEDWARCRAAYTDFALRRTWAA